MEIWIPEKREIENILEIVLAKLRKAERVSDVDDWIDDELLMLRGHVSNRARREQNETRSETQDDQA